MPRPETLICIVGRAWGDFCFAMVQVEGFSKFCVRHCTVFYCIDITSEWAYHPSLINFDKASDDSWCCQIGKEWVGVVVTCTSLEVPAPTGVRSRCVFFSRALSEVLRDSVLRALTFFVPMRNCFRGSLWHLSSIFLWRLCGHQEKREARTPIILRSECCLAFLSFSFFCFAFSAMETVINSRANTRKGTLITGGDPTVLY